MIGEAWAVARSLPGGYARHVSPQQQISFIRASRDFQNRCVRHDPRSVSSQRRDATIMVALNRAAPKAELLGHLGVSKPPKNTGGGLTVPWFALNQCDPRAVAILAHGVGATPSQIGG